MRFRGHARRQRVLRMRWVDHSLAIVRIDIELSRTKFGRDSGPSDQKHVAAIDVYIMLP